MCSQPYLLENLTIVLSLFSPSRLQASIWSPEIFTPIWCRILQTVDPSWSCSTEQGMPTTSSRSRQEYCTFFQHCCSIELSCLTTASFTFLTKTISDSNIFKLQCIYLISFVFIVLLVCSWIFKKSLRSCVVFKGCNVSSV